MVAPADPRIYLIGLSHYVSTPLSHPPSHPPAAEALPPGTSGLSGQAGGSPTGAAKPKAAADEGNAAASPPVFREPPQQVSSGRPTRGLWVRGIGWLVAGRTSAWLASAALHATVLLALWSWLFSVSHHPSLELRATMSDPVDEIPEFLLDTSATPSDGGDLPGTVDLTVGTQAMSDLPTTIVPTLVGVQQASVPSAVSDFQADIPSPLRSLGGGFSARRPGNRREAALAGGGTKASEAAVEAGLAWLAAHQWQDGSWNFDLERCPQCGGLCRDSGYFRSRTAATGLAVLSFLGAGYTHHEGPYQDEVRRGLYFLSERMAVTSMGGDLRDRFMHSAARADQGLAAAVDLVRGRGDNLYSHAIATLALTEGYGMTRDRELKTPAQLAADFIVKAQLNDGGWRYAPVWETPSGGDTTVSGWQAMALKSATLAGLNVPYDVWLRFDTFLNSVQVPTGVDYHYRKGEKTTLSNTAIGLLCRMVMGRPLKDKHLAKGIARLGSERPSRQHMYFNYYASQVLHHAGGPRWKKWNPRMRDYLVNSQATDGHESGSWYFSEPHSTQGGRLYTTTMAIMTLEVYYRYLPLYQENVLGE